MMGSILEWSMVVLFAVLAIILLFGKGAFLIAGYNTASRAEKAMYDEKKLCRVMGSGMAALAIIMAISASFGYDKPSWIMWLLPVGIILVVVIMLILSNTICKSKNQQEMVYQEDDELSSKNNKKLVIGVVVFVAAILIITTITLVTGDIKTTINDSEINIIGSYWSDYALSLDAIEDISLKDDINLGKRTNGMGSIKLSEGSFKNAEFGSYTLYVYNKCKSYIIIDTTEGMVVINAETPEATKELYEKIVTKLK